MLSYRRTWSLIVVTGLLLRRSRKRLALLPPAIRIGEGTVLNAEFSA